MLATSVIEGQELLFSLDLILLLVPVTIRRVQIVLVDRNGQLWHILFTRSLLFNLLIIIKRALIFLWAPSRRYYPLVAIPTRLRHLIPRPRLELITVALH